MADVENPWEPTSGLMDGISSAMQEWGDALENPRMRAALLQTGLNLMQPPAFGQTTGGHIAQAIGAGGETIGRLDKYDDTQRELDRKEFEADSRADLRIAQSQSAADKLELAKEKEASQRKQREAYAVRALGAAAQSDANVKRLEAIVAAMPANDAAKNALAEARKENQLAQAALAATRNELAPQETENRTRREETRATDAETRQERARTAADANTIRREQMKSSERVRVQIQDSKDSKLYQEAVAGAITEKQKKALGTEAEWRAANGYPPKGDLDEYYRRLQRAGAPRSSIPPPPPGFVPPE